MNEPKIPEHERPFDIEGHPGTKPYWEGECWWDPKRGWRVRGSGNPGKPCHWQGHPWGDLAAVSDTEGDLW